MTPKERFICALRGGIPDMIPIFDFLFSRPLYREVLKINIKDYDSLTALKLAEELDHDGVCLFSTIPEGYKIKFTSSTEYVDEWGTKYKINDSSWPVYAPIDYSIKDENDLHDFKVPNPNEESRYFGIIEAIENNKKQIAIIGATGNPFSMTSNMIGIEKFSIMAIENIKFIKEIFRIATDYFFNQISMLKKIGVDVICVADDLGYGSSTFFSPYWYRENLFPYFKEIVDEIKRNDLPVFLHSDGNLNSIIGDFIDLGFDGLHPIEKKANMNLKNIREKFGNKICLIGNVDSSTTLVFGNEKDVAEETLQCIKDGGKDGAYILAADHSYHDDIPNKNIFKMIEIGRRFGKYPINMI